MAEERAASLTWEDVPQYKEDLQKMARALLQGEGKAESVQTTEVVNAALWRQRRAGQDWDTVTWVNRQQFFRFAHHVMRQFLKDRARARRTQKRMRTVHLDEAQWANMAQAVEEVPEQVQALLKVLEELKQTHPQWADIVEYRYFSGLTIHETAQMLGVQEHTVDNRWRRNILPLLRREVRRIVQEE
jgi:RNA polymerase sigma factor (TIGR02999 family)